MMSGSKSKCEPASNQPLIDNAKSRLNDLEERFTCLRSARKEGRVNDVLVLEEQVCQILREWNSELSALSPAISLLGGSLGSFSDDIGRLLQLCEEQDDATSPLTEPAILNPQPDVQGSHSAAVTFQEDSLANNKLQEHFLQGFDKCKASAPGFQNTVAGVLDLTTQLDYHQMNLHEELKHELLVGGNVAEECEKDAGPNILPNIHPPPSAFMGPKCALWDCTRPAQGSEWYQDYCSSFHAALALNEDSPGMTPVLRPGGISLKDNLLFIAANVKAQGKNVGIPQCEGAANTKCPWNATELFDLSLLKGETIREWLFFDKRRRAFESGTRKQRSLPDHSGRGWHESRKQVMKEFGGQKRSYYMDPQPPGGFEWHLYEYVINSCDTYALYRLELKLVNDKRSDKKSPKGKIMKDSLADLQKKMGQLTAEVPADNRSSIKDQTKTDKKFVFANISSSQGEMTPTTEALHHCSSDQCKLLDDSPTDYYGTY